MKRVIAIMMAGIMLCFSMSGCSVLSAVFGASGSTADTIKAEDGYAEGRIGDTLKTTFFTFRVESAQFVKEYAGYQPEEGNILVDSVVTVKNVFGEDLPMFNSDFQIQWGDGDDDFGYGVEGLEDSTIMPEEYTLKDVYKRQTMACSAILDFPHFLKKKAGNRSKFRVSAFFTPMAVPN